MGYDRDMIRYPNTPLKPEHAQVNNAQLGLKFFIRLMPKGFSKYIGQWLRG